MNARAYSTMTPGKWVLAGEHTVLRGGSAIALPHPQFRLSLEFLPSGASLRVEPDLATPVVHELLRIGKDWLASRGVPFEVPRGTLAITSTIPFGAGLGSSAALSVAMARWVLFSASLDPKLERELAREMENRFHGTSSGMDVAAVSMAEPIYFSMAKGAVPLKVDRLPEFVFFDSGLRNSTRDCIGKVAALRARDPARGEVLDGEMKRATEEIFAGLRTPDEADIERGMKRAGEVFSAWGLVPDEVKAILEKLEREGVRSPRLTGAGGGGFIVGLKSN